MTLIFRYSKTMAFGGVETGNMNAKEIPIVTGTTNMRGLTCMCTAWI